MSRKLVRYFTVDAFTDTAFKGNPAAVCLFENDEEQRDEKWMQSLAAEFNISQTCFVTPIPESLTDGSSIPRFRIRWFTPVVEVFLCGHATLASAHILFSKGLVDSDIVQFETTSRVLIAKKVPDALHDGETKNSYSVELNFPVVPTSESNCSESDVSKISKTLNGSSIVDIRRIPRTDDLLVVLPSWESVTEFQPNFDEILKLPGRGLVLTAAAPPDSEFHFCSRFFCPIVKINEDPVCGSAHCALAPYWSEKMGKSDFVAYAASPRSGTLRIHVDVENQRVHLRGKAVTITEGHIFV